MATTTAAATSHFFGTRLSNKPTSNKQTSNMGRVSAFFNLPAKLKPQPKKKEVKKVKQPESDGLVWFPGAQPPEWLDGTMIGDRGFDPLGFAKPAEYLQFELDSLDQNLAKNLAGDIIGTRVESTEVNPTPFQPYTEVFGIQRFRECEVIHGRWAMLGALGALAVEAFTGVAWQDAGKVELVEGSSYFGLPLPFSISTLIWIEVLVIGYIEFQRNAELDPEKRLYPGGKFFDPLGLASDPEEKERLQLAEIKHSRLAMIVFLIFAIQAAVTGKGPIGFIATFNQ
ncbi:hypothetical protein TSUD_151030 [Trifolium subterraneum]|uniref:Chlorophyll a-b binding protein, chloroplastic n=1 Tax=Trifolium subterraneum TaxID=3900 RepID=A0A2Z6M529_TRISU|nr:hypothetical protein TSUD_151030 [Trifolium subterraneum]